MKAAFNKSISNEYELPIERAIVDLLGEIQCVEVITRYGKLTRPRFNLDKDIFNKECGKK